MINISAATVCRLVELARTFQAQESVSLPHDRADADEDWPMQVLASHANDPTLAEFRSIVDDLEPDQRRELVALMWLGRGDFTRADWAEALELAEAQETERTADYVISHPMVPDHLEDGLAEFGLKCDT